MILLGGELMHPGSYLRGLGCAAWRVGANVCGEGKTLDSWAEGGSMLRKTIAAYPSGALNRHLAVRHHQDARTNARAPVMWRSVVGQPTAIDLSRDEIMVVRGSCDNA